MCRAQGPCITVCLSPKPTSFKLLVKAVPHVCQGKRASEVWWDTGCRETKVGSKNFLTYSSPGALTTFSRFSSVHLSGLTVQIFEGHGSKNSVLDRRELNIKAPFDRKCLLCSWTFLHMGSLLRKTQAILGGAWRPYCAPLMHVEKRELPRAFAAVDPGPQHRGDLSSPLHQRPGMALPPKKVQTAWFGKFTSFYIWDSHHKLFVGSRVQYLSWFGLNIICSRQKRNA